MKIVNRPQRLPARLWFVLSIVFVLPAMPCATERCDAENWPCFRGPSGQGVSTEKNLPLRWSLTENVAWKAEVGGTGWSSPIVWENRVFLTATTEDGKDGRVLCFDRDTGKVLWDETVVRGLPKNKQPNNSHATPTPIADGKRVYAVFNGLKVAALDFDGHVLWTYEEPVFGSFHGLGASPILYRDLLIMPCDGNDPANMVQRGYKEAWPGAFITALDIATGHEKWRAKRGLSRQGHVTPKVIDVDGRPLLVSAGGDVVQGFDLEKGDLIWTVKSKGEGVVPSIVHGNGLVYTASGFDDPTIRAIRPAGRGDVTATNIVWESKKNVPMMPSFLYDAGLLLCVKETGVATCLDAGDGKVVWEHKLGGAYSASPVLAEGHIYCLAENGTTVVFAAAREYKELARNTLERVCRASPAFSSGRIFIRTADKLYCIADKATTAEKNR
jgi:outer membrane protein assembly factor BamB